MIIPSHFQIFEQPVNLSDKDCGRLKSHLGSWRKLNDLLLLGVNDADLRRLIIIELMSERREQILERLVWRLGQQKRTELQDKIQGILSV